MTSVRPHVPEEELHAFRDGELSPTQRAEIAEHLLGCLLCRVSDAEVEELRSRTAALLARAVPRTTRRAASRRRMVPVAWARTIAATLVAVIGGTAWLALQPGTTPTPRLATAAFVTPSLFADLPSMGTPTRADLARRSLSLAAQSRFHPRVVGPMIMPVTRGAVASQQIDDIDPAGGAEWESMSLEAAIDANHGSITRLEGFPVLRVQVRRSSTDERPTVLVRHRTTDGRSLWVVEGPADELTALSEMFAASGLSMSIPLRTRPDYVGSEANPIRTERMIAVAAYLPTDSLNALLGKLRRE
jgi:anti-sigma factor RsiW